MHSCPSLSAKWNTNPERYFPEFDFIKGNSRTHSDLSGMRGDPISDISFALSIMEQKGGLAMCLLLVNPPATLINDLLYLSSQIQTAHHLPPSLVQWLAEGWFGFISDDLDSGLEIGRALKERSIDRIGIPAMTFLVGRILSSDHLTLQCYTVVLPYPTRNLSNRTRDSAKPQG